MKTGTIAECPACGKRYASLDDLHDVRSLGLALKANCTNCSGRLGVNTLWMATGTTELLPEAWSSEKKHSERMKRFREKKQLETR